MLERMKKLLLASLTRVLDKVTTELTGQPQLETSRVIPDGVGKSLDKDGKNVNSYYFP